MLNEPLLFPKIFNLLIPSLSNSGIDFDDNELITLEIIHRYVQILDERTCFCVGLPAPN